MFGSELTSVWSCKSVNSSSRLDALLSFTQFNRSVLRPEMLGHHIHALAQETAAQWDQFVQGRDVLLGVPDDRGVELNQGFLGASSGPTAFRQAFYRLYDVRSSQGAWCGESWVDCGDLVLQSTIAETHAALAEAVHLLLNRGARRVYVVGGGHDFSFGSYLGHSRSCKGVVPIINFDAHFDLRPVDQGQINSGTPFRRVIETLENQIAGGAALLEVGVQRERNPQSLWDYAESKGVSVAEYSAGRQPWIFHRLPGSDICSLHEQINLWLEQWLKDSASARQFHLSIDLDVFHTAAAMGTSASTSFGVPVETLWPCMEDVLSRENCRVVDVAELCPARDHQSQTARLAAALVFRGSHSRDSSVR